jgi:hypothetical protein
MKKYLVASVVAVAVFAMSAFAASLMVDGGVLQAGTGEIGTCTDNIVVTYADPYRDETDTWVVNSLTLDSRNGDGCGNRDFRAVVTSNGTDLSNTVQGRFSNGVAIDVQFEPFNATLADAVDIVVWDSYPSN